MFLVYTGIYTYILVHTNYKSIYLYIQVYTKIIILIQGVRIPDEPPTSLMHWHWQAPGECARAARRGALRLAVDTAALSLSVPVDPIFTRRSNKLHICAHTASCTREASFFAETSHTCSP